MKRSVQRIESSRTLRLQLVFTALAFVSMVVLSYAFMGTIVRGSLVRTVNSVLDFAEDRVEAALLDARSALQGFAEAVRDMRARGSDPAVLQTYINDVSRFARSIDKKILRMQGFYGYFDNMPDGTLVLHSAHHLPSKMPEAERSRLHQAALASRGEIVESMPYYVDGAGTLVTFALCLTDAEGRGLGIVCLDVQIDALGRSIVRTALNQGGYGMLLDQDLLLLAHPNAAFVRRNMSDPDIPIAPLAAELRAGGAVFERGMKSYRGEISIAFFRTLPNGWHLGLVAPEAQYYQSISSMAFILVALGAALAAILIAILIRIDAARARSAKENRQKSMFLANMSHEIRTPINAIVGMTAIGRTAVNAERKDYCFAKIGDASRHLLGVINDILDISKIEANKIELSDSEFLFEKLLQQVVNVVNFRIDEKSQKLTVYIDKAIPRMLVADDQRLAQVITNLLSNAVKFTPEQGAISLKTQLLEEKDGNCVIRVEVSDTGIGISAEQQGKLFQAFQQAESSITRKFGGTGLGLAISKSIVELMGGSIWVESKLGQGTRFAFTVKVKRGREDKRPLAFQNINWGNVRILTVDDDRDILVYFQEIVSGFGARCDVAASANEALQLIDERGAYNMYFVDLKMPDIDGISLSKKIRDKEQQSRHSVIIMISSAELSAVETEARLAGVDKFLLKPLFPSSIADVINECIGLVNDKTTDLPLNINGIFDGHRVLFVEDVDINREIVISLLEPTLLQIDCAENGVEAVRMFNAAPERYDMIFMDVQMPEMDGYEATRHIRALGLQRAGTIPIIAMTAHVFKEDVEECLAVGMNGHLGKPLDLHLLLETLCRYLGRRPQLPESAPGAGVS